MRPVGLASTKPVGAYHSRCLLDGASLSAAIVTSPAGFDVIGANRDLAGMDITLMSKTDSHELFKTAMQALVNDQAATQNPIRLCGL